MKWNEIYAPPFEDMYKVLDDRSGRIKDANGNFVFQFVEVVNKDAQDALLRIINGEEINLMNIFYHEAGYILNAGFTKEDPPHGRKVLLIRGWGNLTGAGSHNMSTEDAIEVQDTFAEYLVSMLNRKE